MAAKRQKPVRYIMPRIDGRGRVTWPRCVQERITRYANDTPQSDKQCALSARVDYRGALMCVRHAAQRALWEVSEGKVIDQPDSG